MIRTSETDKRTPGSGRASVPSDACEEFVRALYEHHSSALLRYPARLAGGDWHRAEDLLQDATVRAWKHFSPAPPTPSPSGPGSSP